MPQRRYGGDCPGYLFFKEFINDRMYNKYDHILYLKDFNVTLNHDLDTTGYLHVTNSRNREYVKSRMAIDELVNAWRDRNKENRALNLTKT